MNAQPARSLMTIGDVLGLLRPEFPDITISKIRFLESEGLVEPERSPSGYRKFADADVERLRFVLTAQRDHYLPLRVIRQHLQARDRGENVPPLGPASGT
ncbi:MerR family transcriptional regulator, partial [Actinomadura sp. KC216]|uniref:transcriptional regulator FtsR n=1 Tax=Actinomadura sp. KC216 TaxID=2530370 RepID=UPI0010442CA7